MKRVVYAAVILAMLAVPVSTAFAEAPDVPNQPIYYGDTILGQLVWAAGIGFVPYERVDAWLYRPPTVDQWGNPIGWPNWWLPPAVGPTLNPTWWWLGGESMQRRWTFSETEGTVFERADGNGNFAFQLMLPRDEVWYPCSFPLKWKCNYDLGPGGIQWHSPQFVAYDPAFVFHPVLGPWWPWLLIDPASDPQDTVSPLQWAVINYGNPTWGWLFESTVYGYAWKVSDLPEPWE